MSVSNRPVALASINSSAWVRYLRVRFALEALAVLLSAAVNPPDAPARNPAADSRPHGSPVPVRPFDPLMPAVVNPRPLMPGCHRVDGTAVIRGTSSACRPVAGFNKTACLCLDGPHTDEGGERRNVPVSVVAAK